MSELQWKRAEMTTDSKWDERYLSGTMSWDLGREDHNLVRLISGLELRVCKALEIGCGTGRNAIWLAKKGFDVTAVDISSVAIKIARDNALEAGVSCRFMATDFLTSPPSGQFGLVFDRGCFHSLDSEEERTRFCANVTSLLTSEGYWVSIIGNSDDSPRDTGPPMRSAEEIIRAVEPFFEVVSLASSHFDSNREIPPKSWELIGKKRSPGTFYETKQKHG